MTEGLAVRGPCSEKGWSKCAWRERMQSHEVQGEEAWIYLTFRLPPCEKKKIASWQQSSPCIYDKGHIIYSEFIRS